MNWIIFVVIFVCSGKFITCEFEEVRPIIWVATDLVAESGSTEHKVLFENNSPCDKVQLLRRASDHEGIKRMYNWIADLCEERCKNTSEAAMVHLIQTASHKKHKREAGKFEREDAFTGVFGGPFGLFQLAKDHSAYHLAHQDHEVLKQLNASVNNSRLRVIDGLDNDLETLDTLEESIKRGQKLQNALSAMPIMAWTLVKLQADCIDRASILNKIEVSAKLGKMNTDELYRLTNHRFLGDIQTDLTHLLGVEKKSSTVEFRFLASSRAINCSIWRAESFRIHEGLSTVKYYDGPLYAFYNATNDCKKFAKAPYNRRVVDSCARHSDINKKTNRLWKTYQISEHDELEPQVIHVPPHAYIYCANYNITMNNMTQACPDHPFRINSSTAFEVGDIAYNFSFVESGSATEVEKVPHYELGFSALNDPLIMNLERMKRRNRDIKDRLLDFATTTEAQAGGSGTIILIVVLLVVYRLYFSDTGRNSVIDAISLNTAVTATSRRSSSIASSSGPSVAFIINNGPTAPSAYSDASDGYYPKIKRVLTPFTSTRSLDQTPASSIFGGRAETTRSSESVW